MSKQNEFTVLRSTDGAISLELREKCAELYCRIWREDPWLEDFWKPEEVMATMEQELARPGAEGLVSIDYNWGGPHSIITEEEARQVTGFTWGYPVDKASLRKIAGTDKLDPYLNGAASMFYVDELGIDKNHRLHGLGRFLSEELIGFAKKQCHGRIILRTDVRAIPARVLYSRLGFTELPIRDGSHESRTYWLL